jgi:hypothetical protein
MDTSSQEITTLTQPTVNVGDTSVPAITQSVTNDPQAATTVATTTAVIAQTATLVNDGVTADLEMYRVRKMLASIIPKFPSFFAKKGIDDPAQVADYSELIKSMQVIRDTVAALPNTEAPNDAFYEVKK